MSVLSPLLPSQNEDWDRIFGDPTKPLTSSKEVSSSSSTSNSKTSKKPSGSPESRKRMEVASEPLPPVTTKSSTRSQGVQTLGMSQGGKTLRASDQNLVKIEKKEKLGEITGDCKLLRELIDWSFCNSLTPQC